MAKRQASALKAGKLADQVEAFMVFSRGRGLQPSTLNRSYGHVLHRILLPFAERAGVETVSGLTPDVLAAFTAELHARKLAKPSVASYVRSVNRFLTWSGVKDPAEKAQRPRLRKVHRDVLTLREMRQLEQAAPSVRDQLIIRILADTGCRRSELAALRLSDVVMRGREWYVLINGKTGERKPPISEEVYARLKSYTSHTRPRVHHEGLFVSAHRHPETHDYEPLRTEGVYQVVKDVASRLGWTRRIYPHLLRHSWITHMEAAHVDPAVIAEVAGVSIEVIVRNYSHLSDRDRHQAIMRALLAD